ncbi:unnamed protein product [Lupinus luteus]|uniref:Uncharacterized protein n=1 Tax=Lupinus luteus TaxID=3873 RepID=A0AAV1X0T7_LUPLU
MKEKNKGVEAYNNTDNMDMDCYYSTYEVQCKTHPSSSSSVGICSYCLKERLVKLVCSDCGEQRLSSCSCSDVISSNRNSCTIEVGRVSFLIENEKNETPYVVQHLNSNKGKLQDKEEDHQVMMMVRSSSNCVEIKKNGFWRIMKLFRKKNEKCGRSVVGFDEESETWIDHRGVSRSRSLCSFRGDGIFGSDDGGDSVLSGAWSSISAARSSGVNMLEPGRRSGYSEAEPRRSGFNGEKRDFFFEGYENNTNRLVFSLRESDFKGMEESSFIDLKLDYSSESTKHEFSAAKMDDTLSAFGSTRGDNFMVHDGEGGSYGNGVVTSGGSCRISVNDRGVKRGRKSMKGWRWIFKHHSDWGNEKKKDQHLISKT